MNVALREAGAITVKHLGKKIKMSSTYFSAASLAHTHNYKSLHSCRYSWPPEHFGLIRNKVLKTCKNTKD